VAAVAGAAQHGDVVPGQAGAAGQQRGLVGLGTEQVVRLLAGDQEPGGVRVGLQRVGGDHRAGQVGVGQQRLEGGDLARGAVDPALGEDDAGGVVHRGQQVGLPAVGCASGAAQGLAVDRDRPSPLAGVVAVGKHAPIAAASASGSRGPGSGGSWSRWDRPHPAAGAGIAAGPGRGTHGLGCLRGPLGDRGDRPRAAKTAAAASTRMATSGCRRPARAVGSVTVAR
jgi:hypothetical protein